MADIKVRVASAAARTNRDARAQLGVAADYLRRAYDVLPDLPTYEGVRDNARELIDRVNLYAQGIYATIPDDDAPLADVTRARVLVALSQADEDLQLLDSVNAALRVDYLAELADIIPAGAGAIAAAAVGAASEHWILTLAIVMVAGFLFLGWRKVGA